MNRKIVPNLLEFYACLTQSVEYRFCKQKVIGSTPIASFKNVL